MPIPHITYDTMNYPLERRFDVWREALSSTYDIYLHGSPPEEFSASVDGWMIGQLMVARLQMAALSYTRRAQKICDETSDNYLFMCAIEGGGSTGEFDGRPFISRTGDT